MPFVPDAVREEDLDHFEILARGGANCGDEDFILCKCPHCSRVYLFEYEADAIYWDADDLSLRANPLNGFTCVGCNGAFPTSGIWIGENAPEAMQVTWRELEASPWRWVSTRTRPDR